MQKYGLSNALLSQQSRKLSAENEGIRVGSLTTDLSKGEGGMEPKYSIKLENALL